MHWTDIQKEYVCKMCEGVEWEIWKDNIGVIGWLTVIDFDCKLKTNVLLLYCKPEYRGLEFLPMIKRLEEIAKSEGAEKIIIGESMSEYKEKKFNSLFSRLGYNNSGFIKDL
jgi:hypothetical protein